MRNVGDQLAAVLSVSKPVRALDVVLTDAVGCILAADLIVPADVPILPVAACDGYAVSADSLSEASQRTPVTLPVVSDVWSAAAEPLRLVPGQSVRVATGAAVPIGADAIVPIEYSDRGDVRVRIAYQPAPGDHVIDRGSHARSGTTAIAAGTRMGARQIALAASLGYARVRVHPKPRVVIITVGDELVAPVRQRASVSLEGMIFDANGPALRTAVQDAGATAIQVGPISDDHTVLREAIEDQLVRADLVVTTGGMSDGPRDTLRDVLAPLGTVRFDRVAMSPGKLQGLGMLGVGDEAVPLFALPGHPVSALIAYEVFVRPALRTMAGYTEIYRPSVLARAAVAWPSLTGERQFVPASLVGSPEDGYQVTPVGDPARLADWSVSALAQANALVVVPEEQSAVRLGDPLHCMILEG